METWSVSVDIRHETGSVLLIESDPGIARAMEAELIRGGFTVSIAHSHLGALGMMEDLHGPHILLIPADPTDIDGFDFVHLVRHRNRFLKQNLRIIMAGSGENFVRLSRNDEGVDDFLLRPYFPGELVWRVRKAWKILEPVGKANLPELMDASTGIFSPTGIKRTLHEELNKSFRKQTCFSLAVVGFHGLDEANLNYGRMLAEWMEQDLSKSIRLALRSYDRLGRVDSGRYCLIAPDVDQEHLQKLLVRLGRHVEDWNESVARNSYLRTPLELRLRALAILPQFEPEHLTKAVTLLWDWICRDEVLEEIAQAHISGLALTSQVVIRQQLFLGSEAACLPDSVTTALPGAQPDVLSDTKAG